MLRKYSIVAKKQKKQTQKQKKTNKETKAKQTNKKSGGKLILINIKIHPHDYVSILYCLRYKFCGRTALP